MILVNGFKYPTSKHKHWFDFYGTKICILLSIHSDKKRLRLVSILKKLAYFDETHARVAFSLVAEWQMADELGALQEISSAVIKLCLFPLL